MLYTLAEAQDHAAKRRLWQQEVDTVLAQQYGWHRRTRLEEIATPTILRMTPAEAAMRIAMNGE